MANPTTATPWIRTLIVGRDPRWTLARIAFVVIATVVLLKYVVLLRKIESVSMLPTFREGSVHVINRLAYRGDRRPQRGDIVGIRTSGDTIMYVKRIIGLPGETIAIVNGTVVINSRDLDEPYVRPGRFPWNRPTRQLRDDQYFVIGDNRSMRQDQHEFGAVDADRIQGRVVW